VPITFPELSPTGGTHTAANRTWQWDGLRWKRHDLAGVEISDTPPNNPILGMRWINSTLWRAFEYSGKEWVEVSSQGSPGRQVELRSTSTHVQWKYVGDETWIDLFDISSIVPTSILDGGDPFSVPDTILDGGAP
jgi:hypothetical protein